MSPELPNSKINRVLFKGRFEKKRHADCAKHFCFEVPCQFLKMGYYLTSTISSCCLWNYTIWKINTAPSKKKRHATLKKRCKAFLFRGPVSISLETFFERGGIYLSFAFWSYVLLNWHTRNSVNVETFGAVSLRPLGSNSSVDFDL